jgi:predicted acetyltransferase
VSVAVRPCASLEDLRAALNGIGHYFGQDNTLEDAERFAQWIELDRMLLAEDGGAIVGGTGSFTFRLSVPGGDVPAAGVTVVGVLPTHRRRGALTALMRAELEDARAHGEPVSYLWASEATIYGRFGYGLASRAGKATIDRDRAGFAVPFESRGSVRVVDADEAAVLFPPLYEQVRAQRPGMFSRSDAWWRTRRLHDDPARRFAGAGALDRVVLELDGAPAGYALYRVKQEWDAAGFSTGSLIVLEAISPTPQATRELWRWLLDFDWTAQIVADLLPLDHPLFLLLAEPRRAQLVVGDGLWVRLVDVEAALAARSYGGDGELVVDVTDAFLPENAGRWRLGPGGAERTDASPELRLDVTGLGSVYLGGFRFVDLVRASRAEELVAGAADRGDDLFRTPALPWCSEIF